MAAPSSVGAEKGANTVADSVVDTAQVLVLTPEIQQALAGLRELQWVEALAVRGTIDGRWMLAAGAILLALALLFAGLFVRWRRQPRQRALTALQHLRRTLTQNGDAVLYVTELASLLRQVAYHHAYHRAGKADCPPGITGQDWLAWLDQTAPPNDRGAFADGPGHVLAVLPFARSAGVATIDTNALHALSERWLRANL